MAEIAGSIPAGSINMSFEEEVQKANLKGVVTGAIISALGFLVALSWRDTITATINTFVPKGEGVTYLYISSIIITVVAVLMAYVIVKVQKANIIPDKIETKVKEKKRMLKTALIKV